MLLHIRDSNRDCRNPIADGRVKPPTGFGQRQGLWPPTKQRTPEVTFQQSDLVADRGRRYAQLSGGLLKAQMARCSLEGPQFDQWWQIAHVGSLDENASSWHEIIEFACRRR
jgi:hypothetical protein